MMLVILTLSPIIFVSQRPENEVPVSPRNFFRLLQRKEAGFVEDLVRMGITELLLKKQWNVNTSHQSPVAEDRCGYHQCTA